MRRNSGLFELKFKNELEKQEFIERSLIELIESTGKGIKMLKFQNRIETGMLAAFIYFGYPLLKEQTPASSAVQVEQGFSFWKKTLLTCAFAGCVYCTIRTGKHIKEQEKIHADSIRDLPEVRELILKLKAQPSPTQNIQATPSQEFTL